MCFTLSNIILLTNWLKWVSILFKKGVTYMKLRNLVFILGLILVIFSLSLAEGTSRQATIVELKGKAEVRTPEGSWVEAKLGMVLNQGAVLRTKKKSWLVLNLDGMAETAVVEVKENSQLKLSQLLENKQEATQNTLLDLALGEILIKAKKLHSEKSKFEVKTPTSIVGVRGTSFSVTVEAVE